jgi:hypothetical protein
MKLFNSPLSIFFKKEKTMSAEKERKLIFSAIADSVLELSDDEILQETREQGFIPEEIATKVSDIFRIAIQNEIEKIKKKKPPAYEEAISLLSGRRKRIRPSNRAD